MAYVGLYLFVSDAVNNRIDAWIEVDHGERNVEECAGEVVVWSAEEVHEIKDLIERPAQDEKHGNGRQSLDDVHASFTGAFQLTCHIARVQCTLKLRYDICSHKVDTEERMV